MSKRDSPLEFDVVICGAGVAGLWLLNVLVEAGYNVLLVESDALGGLQTIGSQGMIHGGQRYSLGASTSRQSESIAGLPAIWNSCLSGTGRIDLRGVQLLSDSQYLWSLNWGVSNFMLHAAKFLLTAKMKKLQSENVPSILSYRKPLSVFELPEKVLNVSSLISVLCDKYKEKIFLGTVNNKSINGNISVSGIEISAQQIICCAGAGNDNLLNIFGLEGVFTQYRPLRQIMVKPMYEPLFGHCVSASYKPRLTVTSHALNSKEYVWYLGGALADTLLTMSDEESVTYARSELKLIFPHIEWDSKEIATCHYTRAEAKTANGLLPEGPVVEDYGNVLGVWPTKLTFAPLLGDLVLTQFKRKGVVPKFSSSTKSVKLPFPPMAEPPWNTAEWHI